MGAWCKGPVDTAMVVSQIGVKTQTSLGDRATSFQSIKVKEIGFEICSATVVGLGIINTDLTKTKCDTGYD